MTKVRLAIFLWFALLGASIAHATDAATTDVKENVQFGAKRLDFGSPLAFTPTLPAFGLVDDRNITITSPKDVKDKRAALINFIWGSGGFPNTKLPSSVTASVPDPIGATNLERVDELRIVMDAGLDSVVYHFIPSAHKRNELVIVYSGHWCGLDGFIINALLDEGYSALGVFMPHQRPGDCGAWPPHDDMFKSIQTNGSPMKFFLEPVAVSLNYLAAKHASDGFPRYTRFHMTGLSGGGWATTVYAAIDPRIEFSAPVAGSIPLYLRSGKSIGDIEQTLDAFYQIAGYPDLYVMGSYGLGRRQAQILNRRDDCCFGEAHHNLVSTGESYDEAMRTYEKGVRRALRDLGVGSFRLEIDEASDHHQTSANALWNIILADLNHDRRLIGAATKTDAFVRGMGGNLWHRSPTGWEDTGLAMVGGPAVIQGVAHDFDLFFRDPRNHLKHGYPTTSGWRADDMGGPALITDPAATTWGPGRFDVVAFGRDFVLQHWWSSGGTVGSEAISAATGLGTPAISSWGPDRLDVFFRALSGGTVKHVSSTGSATWSAEDIGGVIRGSPAVVTTGGDALRVFARGQSGGLWQARQTVFGSWRWAALPEGPLFAQILLAGSPSASIECGVVQVHVRTAAGEVASFSLVDLPIGGAPVAFTFHEAWNLSRHGGAVTGSPTSIPGGAFARGRRNDLYLFETTDCMQSKGGMLD